ncbi:MAG: transferrin-binding protein-like solute binding protein, partial [Alphaproteobacteria bacterium]|nr:transferrin-binding protein-like solute binding protein [Alphaproteobacteria bacterium]
TELTGKADARFYGPDADELGGTFSLADNNVSYIGYFGATINAPDDETTITTPSQPIDGIITKPEENLTELTGFTDMNRNGKTGIALPVSAVEFNYDNNKPINHRITDVVVEFSYDAEGYFVTGDDDGNGLKFYFANKQYTIKNYDRSFRNDNYISAYGVDNIASTDGNSPQILGLDRDRGLLEFTSDYMAVLYWSLEDTTGEALQEEESGFYGYGITGFETKGSDIFSDSLTAAFYGRGRGQYRDATTPFSEQHVFSLTANVNFAKRIVALRGENTCRNSFTPGNCDIRQTPHLNFSGDLSYVADTNIITGTLTTTGDNDNEKLSGMADARFYGTNDDVSTELGGTFSMTNADASYIGFFGLRREYIASLDKPKSLNENGLTGFNDPNRNGTTNNVLPMANSVVIIKNSDYTTEINKITGAMAEFDYAADGKFYKYGIKLYFDDKRYSLVYAIVHSDSLYTTHNEAGSADSPAYIYITKEKTSFGDYDSRPAYYRPAYYMAMVRWLFYQSVDYEGYGYSMAGWESNGTDIPITGTDVSFTGKGEGSYYGTSDGINRYLYTAEFDVVATVNFEDAQVGITTSNTCTRSNCYDSQKRDYLNFTGTLNYTKGVNAITGAITTAGDADNPQMTGTADARFYGTGDDVATELGGTFNFTSDDAGYVGHFGALKR